MISNASMFIGAYIQEENNCNIIEFDSHMTSLIIDLTWLEQFNILTYSEIDLSFIICHLAYWTFLANFFNQLFELTFSINFFNQFTLN